MIRAYARGLMRVRSDATYVMAVIDYSNVLPGRMDEDLPEPSVIRLRNIALTVARVSGASNVLVRLYGGWTMKEGSQSDAASRALLTSAQADPFPIPKQAGFVHGRFELATSLLSVPEFELPETYRVRGSVPRIRIRGGVTPTACIADSETCPATLLKRFTRHARKKCPAESCTVTCEMAFEHAEQKMVDTHMTSDILYAAQSGEFNSIVVVSGDTDLVPPLLQVASYEHTPVTLIPANVTMPSHIIEALVSKGVKVIEDNTNE